MQRAESKMFHPRLKHKQTMSPATSPQPDIPFVPKARELVRASAPMSLIFLALAACSSPQQRVVDEIVTSWREQRALPDIDETLTIDAAYRVQTRSVRARLQGAR